MAEETFFLTSTPYYLMRPGFVQVTPSATCDPHAKYSVYYNVSEFQVGPTLMLGVERRVRSTFEAATYVCG